ncbi:hypothetical protein H2201_008332 [Coniosporium apollinis]|uniref:DUF155 domain-containing protein n=2 Tax=Coniosporium TaxID=2810619 RepID=A0ABQ9NKQ3_9PEZI|nr:hypothetical protein H2199_001985 [Cladosporium sp. JES 115]KAJ9656970.1 hypothetical protein H2201_008332 [Coniosporium apollinis]
MQTVHRHAVHTIAKRPVIGLLQRPSPILRSSLISSPKLQPLRVLGAQKPFSSSAVFFKKQSQQQPQPPEVPDGAQEQLGRKPSRASAGKTSLRRVAVEAERSRAGFIKRVGRTRYVDPEVETKTITAYCAAEQYNVSVVARLVESHGFALDPCQTGLYPQVVHIQTANTPSLGAGDIFIFPSGTVVAWNTPEKVAFHLVTKILPPAAEGSHLHLVETEDFGYLEDPQKEWSSIIGDTIILGTKSPESSERDTETTQDDNTASAKPEDKPPQNHEVDTILAKIAFSSGLARSTKLAVLETLLSSYFESTRTIPTSLSRGSRLPFTRSFILRKTGELLSIRAQLNLYSELTDSLPDLFWDSRHELGLEGYYDDVGRALDVGVRIKTLNEKMDYAQEIASVLRERLSEKHGLLLEWGIIALISIEVAFELRRLWKERKEHDDPDSTEMLLRRFLKAAIAKRESS